MIYGNKDFFTPEQVYRALGSTKLEHGIDNGKGPWMIQVSGNDVSTSSWASVNPAVAESFFLPSAGVLPSIKSGSANDTNGGAGWGQLQFYGWDENGDYQAENVLLSGIATANFTQKFTSLNWGATVVRQAGLFNTNSGLISVMDNSANVIAGAAAQQGAIASMSFKVPVGHKAQVAMMTLNKDSFTTNVFARVRVRQSGTAEWMCLPGTPVVVSNVPTPTLFGRVELLENTDIDVQVIDSGGSSTVVGGSLFILLYK